MTDYISREAAIEATCFNCSEKNICGGSCDDVDRLCAIHAADVRENKRGKWVWNDQSKLVCSLCGNVVAFVSHPKKKWEAGYFCPSCGADMREEQT